MLGFDSDYEPSDDPEDPFDDDNTEGDECTAQTPPWARFPSPAN